MKMAAHWARFNPEMIYVEDVYYQKAIAHFAREYMNEGKIPYMSIRGIKPESNIAKELRIRALEPLACNFAIHCKESHKDFIEEFTEYTPNSRMCKKDILDASAYQIQVARPGVAKSLTPLRAPMVDMSEVNMDEVMEGLLSKGDGKGKDSFGNPGVDMDAFNDNMISVATDPFGGEW